MQRIKNNKAAQPRRLKQEPFSSWDKAVLVSLNSSGRNGQLAFNSQVIIVSSTTM